MGFLIKLKGKDLKDIDLCLDVVVDNIIILFSQ